MTQGRRVRVGDGRLLQCLLRPLHRDSASDEVGCLGFSASGVVFHSILELRVNLIDGPAPDAQRQITAAALIRCPDARVLHGATEDVRE